MDACPKDGVVSYRELKRYHEEVPKGLVHDYDSADLRDVVWLLMARMDDDSNR